MACPAVETHPGEGHARGLPGIATTREFQRQHHVFFGRQGVEQMELLENEAHPRVPQPRARILIERAEILPVDETPPGRGHFKSRQESQ